MDDPDGILCKSRDRNHKTTALRDAFVFYQKNREGRAEQEKILASKEVYVAPGVISGIYYNLGDLERG